MLRLTIYCHTRGLRPCYDDLVNASLLSRHFASSRRLTIVALSHANACLEVRASVGVSYTLAAAPSAVSRSKVGDLDDGGKGERAAGRDAAEAAEKG